MNWIKYSASTQTILAIDLSKYKNVVCILFTLSPSSCFLLTARSFPGSVNRTAWANVVDHPKIRTDDSGNLLLNFGKYGGDVEVAFFSTDGSRLLTVKEVGVARIWEVASGRQVGEIRPTSPLSGTNVGPTTSPFQIFIEAAILDATGEIAILGLNDGTAGLFEVADGSRLATFHHPDRTPATQWELIRAVNLSPDGSLAVVGFYGRCAGVWNVSDGRLIAFLRSDVATRLHHSQGWVRDTLVSSVAISKDNRYVFAGHSDMTATMWNLATERIEFDAYEHQEEILDFRQEADSILWAASGGNIREATAVGVVDRLVTGESWQEVAFAPNRESVLVRTRGNEVKRWSINGEATCIAKLDFGQGWIGWSSSARSLMFAPDGQAWSYPVGQNAITIADNAGVRTISCRVQSVLSTFSPNGRLLASFGDTTLRVWDVSSGQLIGELSDDGHFHAAAFSPDGSLLAAGTLGQVTAQDLGPPRTICLWSTADRRLICRWSAHDHQVHALAFLPDGRNIISTSLDRTVRRWKVSEHGNAPVEVARLKYADLNFMALHVLSDGRIVVFRQKCIEVWNGLKEKVSEIPTGVDTLTRWRVSADERSMAIARGRQTIEVWSLADGRKLAAHVANIAQPEIVPDEQLGQRRPFTAGGYLWRTLGGNFIHIGDGPRGWATPLRLFSDGRQLVMPCQESAVLIDLNGQQEILAEFPFEGRLRAACVTEDIVQVVNSSGKVLRVRLGPKSQ